MAALGVVRAEAVSKRFGATMALRSVNAVFEPGLTLLTGPNGSGKSTLLGVLGTVLRPTSGRVLYGGLGEDRGAARSLIGWLSHESLSYGDLTGQQNVKIAAAAHGMDPIDAWGRVAERFELGAFAQRPLRTNSRGQRQRVALARSLVHRPSLLLLDEPTTGLDTGAVARLLEVVTEEVDRGVTVVVVTHDDQVFPGQRREIKLNRGRVH